MGAAEPWGEVRAGKGVGQARTGGGTGTFGVPTWWSGPWAKHPACHHLILPRALGSQYYLHFIEEKTEAQGKETQPSSRSWKVEGSIGI